jgi:dihydroorotate dehydrogenase (NAD+) catalytic subunit
MYRQDLALGSPWMNAAGTLGYLPPARWPVSGLDAKTMGAFLTNPVSLGPRTPAAGRALLPYPGGALLHSGLPNLGLSRVLRRFAARWAQTRLPVWVHLIGSVPDEIHQMVRRLEGVEGVQAVEIGIPPGATGDQALAFVEAAYGELPVAVHLPLTRVSESWVKELPGLGASAVCLGPPRGALPDGSGRLVAGRLYGPGLFPLVLAAVQAARGLGIPVIAGAGVYQQRDAQALFDAGARAVQLDTVLWRGWLG